MPGLAESTSTSSMSLKINLIVAAAGSKLGIGKDGTLPWRLPTDFATFVKLTTETTSENQNAVIMGRKCYESIPKKFRPLKNRINYVLSRTLTNSPNPNVVLCSSMGQAIEHIKQNPLIETVWNIGGCAVYEESIKSNNFHRIYLTKIQQEVDCDVYFPQVDFALLKEVHDDRLPTGIINENGLDYTFHCYERVL